MAHGCVCERVPEFGGSVEIQSSENCLSAYFPQPDITVAPRSTTIPLLSPDSGLAKLTKGFLPEKKAASYAGFTRCN